MKYKSGFSKKIEGRNVLHAKLRTNKFLRNNIILYIFSYSVVPYNILSLLRVKNTSNFKGFTMLISLLLNDKTTVLIT